MLSNSILVEEQNEPILQTPLLPQQSLNHTNQYKFKQIALNGAKVAMAIISSIGPAITYWPTGMYCMLDKHCGGWLPMSATIGQYVLTVSGAGGFSAGNAYYGACAIQATYIYFFVNKEGFLEPTTLLQKMMRLSAVALFAIPMPLQTYLINKSSDIETTMLTLSIISAISPSLFTANNVLQKIIPYFINFANTTANNPTLRNIKKINHDANIIKNVQANIIEKSTALLRTLMKADKSFFMQYHHYTLPEIILADILNHYKQPTPLNYPSTFYKNMALIGNSVGVITAIGPCIPVIANAIDFLDEYIPNKIISIMLAILISYTSIYGNLKLCTDLFSKSAKLFADFIERKPVNSVAFQTHPARTTTAIILSIIFSVLSYSLMYFLFKNSIMIKPHDTKLDDVMSIGLWFSVITIVVYHLASYIELFLLISKQIARNPKERILYELENFIDLLSHMTPTNVSNFIDSLDQNNPFKALYEEIKTSEQTIYEKRYITPSSQLTKNENATISGIDIENIDAIQPESSTNTTPITHKENHSKGWFGNCLCFFSTKNSNLQPENISALSLSPT